MMAGGYCKDCIYDGVDVDTAPCGGCYNYSLFKLKKDLVGKVKEDLVNHPSHYETGKFECIDVMTEAIGLEKVKGFCVCNAFKYIYRCTKKHETPVEDVKKAVWYLNKFLELEGALDE